MFQNGGADVEQRLWCCVLRLWWLPHRPWNNVAVFFCGRTICRLYLVFPASVNALPLLGWMAHMAFFFPPSCYLLQGQCYFWLDAAQLHQSLKHPRLLGYCVGGRDGFSCCSAYRPNPSTPPLQKILILLSALLEHNAAPVREHIKGIWMLMQLVFWLKTIFSFFLCCLTFFRPTKPAFCAHASNPQSDSNSRL